MTGLSLVSYLDYFAGSWMTPVLGAQPRKVYILLLFVNIADYLANQQLGNIDLWTSMAVVLFFPLSSLPST